MEAFYRRVPPTVFASYDQRSLPLRKSFGAVMRIHLIAVGHRMPRWVNEGFEEFARRMPAECALRLVEIVPGKRAKGADTERIVRDEGRRLLAAVPKGCRLLVLDVSGHRWTTPQLARELASWLQEGRDLGLLVGGPDGLSEECRRAAEGTWSLSPLTFPHGLVRILVAEQLYRAWSLLHHHPYHR